jgi:hypothetical protein
MLKGLTFSQILALIFQGYALFESSEVELEAGQPVSTPSAEVGTLNNQPVYAKIVFSTTR